MQPEVIASQSDGSLLFVHAGQTYVYEADQDRVFPVRNPDSVLSHGYWDEAEEVPEAEMKRILAKLPVQKFNPNHDPHTGEFTSAGGGSGGGDGVDGIQSELDGLSKAGVRVSVSANAWARLSPNVGPREFVRSMTGSEGQKGLVLNTTDGGAKLRLAADAAHPGALDMFGAKVLGYERIFDPEAEEVDHSILTLMPGSQDGGAIKKMLQSTIPLYEKMGMKSVHLYANLDAGGYAWARYGFQSQGHSGEHAISETTRYASTLVKENASKLSADAMAEFVDWKLAAKACFGKDDAMGMFTDLKTPLLDNELHDVLKAEVPQLHNPTLTKVAMQNQSWNGVLKLNDAWARMRFDKYTGL